MHRTQIWIGAFISILAIAWGIWSLGLRPLNIYDTDWLWGDLAQVYIAWSKYTQDPKASWLISNTLSHPVPLNFALFDPMPILLLAFGWLSNFVPDKTQWIGTYFMACLVLQGLLGFLVVNEIVRLQRTKPDYFFSFIASIFFIVTPFTFYRFVQHTALSSQWVIVLSIYVSLKSLRTSDRVWLTLNVPVTFFVSGMNPYLTLMVLLSQAGVVLFCENNLTFKSRITRIFCLGIAALIGLYCFGFLSAGAAIGWGYRFFSMNALGPFDSNGLGMLLPLDIKDATGGQSWEGFTYQGLGALTLSLLGLLLCVKKNFAQEISDPHNRDGLLASGVFIIFISYILSLSATVTLSALTWSIPIHKVFELALSVFRSSGRIFWVGGFWILIISIYLIYRKLGPKLARRTLTLLLLVQLVDVSSIASHVRHKIFVTNRLQIDPLTIPYDLQRYSRLIILPPWQCDPQYGPGGGRNYENLGFLATLNKLDTNNFYAARTPAEHSEYHCRPENHLADIRSDTIYIFSETVFQQLASAYQDKLHCQLNKQYDFLMCIADAK